MRLPIRKPPKFSAPSDPVMTCAKFDELTRELEKLRRTRPTAAAEVARLAQLGDFSENAEYQMAKGRLRGINDKIDRLQHQIDHAEIIEPDGACDVVHIGNVVTVEHDGTTCTFHILGSSETDPPRGIISHQSPIGAALLGHTVGDEIAINIGVQKKRYKIIGIV